LKLEQRRTSELTDMVIQHVESGRGVAVLPDWVLQQNALVKQLVIRSLGKRGITRTVYAAVRKTDASNPELKDFIDITPGVIDRLRR